MATRWSSAMSCERSGALRAVSSSASSSSATRWSSASSSWPGGSGRACTRAGRRGPGAARQPAMFEAVDERDHGAAVDPQRAAQCLLGLALVCGEVAEHPEVPGVKVERGEPLGEPPMPMGAQLHQEEAGTAAQPPRRGCLAGVVSDTRRCIAHQNCLCYKPFSISLWRKERMATMSFRYIADDVDAAVGFYVEKLGFNVEMQPGPGFAISRGRPAAAAQSARCRRRGPTDARRPGARARGLESHPDRGLRPPARGRGVARGRGQLP